MNISHYLGCLSGNGVSTGNLIVFYDFQGSSGNHIFNKLYSSGDHILSGYFKADLYPGVAIRTGSTPMSSVLTGEVNGNDILHIGQTFPVSGFTSIIDYEINACNSLNNTRLLISTLNSGLSGFEFGLNRANRLYFDYPTPQGARRATSSRELKDRATVFLSIGETVANFGFYDYDLEAASSNIVQLKNYTSSNDWCIGGGKATGVIHTGFAGYIKNVAIFNKYIHNPVPPIECLTCSGVLWTETQTEFQIYGATSFTYSTSGTSGITSYQYRTGVISHPTGGQTVIVFPSGVSGVVSQSNYATPNFSAIRSGTGITTSSEPKYDYSQREKYGQKTLVFSDAVPSGNLVEIYSYLRPDNNRNILSQNFNLNKLGYPRALLWHNGILNLEGYDYDITGNIFYGVQTQGYDLTDKFAYNRTTGRILTTDYSGVWTRSRVLLNGGTSGTDLEGPTYWPPVAQFLPSGNEIVITGLSGYVLTGYDVYLNGKKLAEGYDYRTGLTGSMPSVIISGDTQPDFYCNVNYSGNGNVYGWPVSSPPTGITNIYTPNITFVERTAAFRRYVFYHTGSPFITYVTTGFSDEIWINGVKEYRPIGYIHSYPCSPTSGNYDYFDWGREIYNSETGYFNVE